MKNVSYQKIKSNFLLCTDLWSIKTIINEEWTEMRRTLPGDKSWSGRERSRNGSGLATAGTTPPAGRIPTSEHIYGKNKEFASMFLENLEVRSYYLFWLCMQVDSRVRFKQYLQKALSEDLPWGQSATRGTTVWVVSRFLPEDVEPFVAETWVLCGRCNR